MRQRIAYGTFAVVAILVLFLSDVLIAEYFRRWTGPFGDLFGRGNLIPLVFLVAALGGAFELARLLRAAGADPHARFAYVMIAVLVLAPWLSAAGWLGSSPAAVEGMLWQVIFMMFGGVGVAVLTVMRGRTDGSLRDAGATMLLMAYLGFLISFGTQLRCGRDVAGDEGAWLLLITVLVTKAADIGGYLVGSTFGRHKLIPSISPGKSVEGTIGGLCVSAGVAVLFVLARDWAGPEAVDCKYCQFVVDATFSFAASSEGSVLSPVVRAIAFGLIVSSAGQLGDFFESCFKRDVGWKDSGRTMPGFGGILDLIDSPIIALPVGWFLLSVVWKLT